MDTNLSRTGDRPDAARSSHGIKRLLRAFSAMAYKVADRVTSPPHDSSPEYYRFPWF
jgi:hypothetical protein